MAQGRILKFDLLSEINRPMWQNLTPKVGVAYDHVTTNKLFMAIQKVKWPYNNMLRNIITDRLI